MKLLLDYTNGNDTKSTSYEAGSFTPQAAIGIVPLDDEASYNSDKSEYILGTAPVTARFKSELLFTDLGLPDDRIDWDFDADDSIDYVDQASFQHTFDDS